MLRFLFNWRSQVDKIIEISKIVDPKERFNVIEEDPEDNVIIDCAVEGKIDYIITKDKHLLNLNEFRGIKIVTPSDFVRICGDYPHIFSSS